MRPGNILRNMPYSAKLILILVVLVLTTWVLRDGLNPDTGSVLPAEDEKDSLINVAGRTVQERIKVPEGFERVPVPEGSFGEYLRNLPLKPHGSRVKYYNGLPKLRNVHVAVLDIDVGLNGWKVTELKSRGMKLTG